MTALTLPDPKRDHISGSADGSIKLLEYGDYECPFCGDVQPIVKEIQRRLGHDLLFVFRNFPLANIHPHAEHAAEAAEAASEQGRYWEMHDILYENQDALDDESLAQYALDLGLDARRVIHQVVTGAHRDRIRQDFHSGIRSGVNGTPAFFVNGLPHNGPWDAESLVAELVEGPVAPA